MLDFHEPSINDKKWVDKCLRHANSLNCEYTFGNVYIWADSYSTMIARYKDFFICRWGKGKNISYSVPLGEGSFTKAVKEIIKDAESLGVKPRIYGLTSSYLLMLQEAFTGEFTYHYDESFNDYIYSTEKMAELRGKKYHGKRNHISNFKKNNPDWSFEEIDGDNILECISLHMKWLEMKQEDSENEDDFNEEFKAVLKAFESYDELGFKGGLIRVNKKVVAFTMGEPQANGKCFVTHFEKAPADMQGAYAIINQEFTRNCLAEYEFVNREEDLGIEGLRKAKMSYHPEILLEKCVAVYND
ncbi:MAG: DUF2156 domain-containing protein [Eubacterium sp.]|nr:DUF2156 domain-containing protein [Eubacterium sp.]